MLLLTSMITDLYRSGSAFSKQWLCLLVLMLLALRVGPLSFSSHVFWHEWLSPGSQVYQVVWGLRWPRACHALCLGGLLGLAGVHLQILTQNSLAEPGLLGINGSASCGALLACLYSESGSAMYLGSLCGAGVGLLLLTFFCSRRRLCIEESHGFQWIFIGALLAAFWGALSSILLFCLPTPSLRPMLFWWMGDLSFVSHLWGGIALLGIATYFTWRWRHRLALWALGVGVARSLGVNTDRLALSVLWLAALESSWVVVHAGGIALLGWLAPHLARLWCMEDFDSWIVTSMVLGGGLLLLADKLSEWLAVPVGAWIAMMTIPVLLWTHIEGARAAR